MSYYRPSQTLAMSRGRGGYSPRGSSYRGHSRGHRGSFNSPRGFSSFDSRSKYSSSERYSSSRNSKFEDYRKPFRSDTYSSRDRSPERKKPRMEGYSSRHDNSYSSSGGRYESSFTDRRSYSGERSMSYPSRKEEFRKPSGPPRGSYRGRGNSRGSRLLRPRERMPPRRRMIDSSYGIRKRLLSSRANDYNRRLKISKLRSAIAERHANKSDGEASDGENKKDSDKEENDDESEKKSVKKEETEEKDHAEHKKKRSLIKLVCPHCLLRYITFRKYEIHLASKNHMYMMRRVVMKQKSILMQMRQAQRIAQNELEKSSGEDLTTRTNFCPVCQLNYKQKKSVHQASEAHKNMKKFVMPFCKICSITFKNRMGYESHCCSIEHLKRKQRMENEASEDSNEEADLENFTTIDSVGDVDEEENEKKEETKEILNVGIENIQKVEAYYCELCKTYLPKVEESEWPKVLAKHCKLLGHMKRYVQYKEDKELEDKAKKLQKKEMAEKEEKAKKAKDDDQSKDVNKSVKSNADESDVQNKSIDEDENKDDKMWADVDKDLGDILADAEDDDEEESSLKTKERYDRFKLSEKNGEENSKDEKEGEPASNGPTEDVKEDS
ncbi:fibronectin-binding protein PlpA isoform X2 [Coccinella septempunctata]|uniref:fibronectin-binding protein PlpA isoform X2 n=1 Tax=Coccinella septempunctata TaxID=41139 RepID=UPI001D07CE0C|nr:fibronectin-binding protein PlpA isoform X2 [Coccinella septempunctata]XP_044766681.1 fibronectin-binding protein PlpA isoform X2 [Coccinella septempunctata]